MAPIWVPVMKNGREISLTALLQDLTVNERRGNHGKERDNPNGRCVGACFAGKGKMKDVAFTATIRAAAPWQPLRRKNAAEDGTAVKICSGDIRAKKRSSRQKAGILFVVDASRSQGADHRLALAKGAALSLISQAYCSRDKVGLIVFGNKRAELALPMTKSVEYAKKCLEDLPAAGNTPLGLGLRKALEVFEQEEKKGGGLRPFLVVFTDGKANYDDRDGIPYDLALEEAHRIRARQIPAVVVDTEKGFMRLGLAKKLADAAGAEYLCL